MVDSITNRPGGSILKTQAQLLQAHNVAQSASRTSGTMPVQSAAKAAKSFFETITQSLEQVPRSVKPTTTSITTTNLADAAPTNTNLPRGSLIDILA